MRRLLAVTLIIASVPGLSLAQARREVKDANLGKKATSVAPDRSLAGDIERKKADKTEAAPALQYDQYRLGVEGQVASKRAEQIASLKKIIELSPKDDQKERPDLLFRLGELYWEESKFYFFEANRKDDDYIKAMNRGDKAGMAQAKAEKEELLAQQKGFSKLAIDQYSEIIQRHQDYKRTDEVLYFLGNNLMEGGEERKALVAFKRLLDKFPKSKFVPDAHLAFGEYYFNSSKGKRENLVKALESYKAAAAFPENQVYAFALYKQGWCYYNLNEFQRAMDMFKAVVLYGEYAGTAAVEKDGGKSKTKKGLVKEARTDFVRAFSRAGRPEDARSEFAKLSQNPDDRFLMMKQLANLYYEDGKDREAALTFNTLIKERPLSPEAPGFQGKIVDCVLRAGNKKMTVEQVRRLVKITTDVKQSAVVKTDKDKQALAEAGELSERTLSNLAVNWHNEARKTRDDETFGYANDVYSDYLTLFPDSPKSYDLRFFWAELLNDNLQRYDKAAEEYTRVVMVDARRMEGDGKGGKPQKPGKYLNDAAYNAVLAWDRVVQKAEESGKLKKEENPDPTKKLKIPPERQYLLEACERYLKYVPKGDKKVEIAFKAANIYYRHNHFDESVQRFSQIALGDPNYKFENGDRAAEVSANLILDSYNLTNEPAKVNEWARKFYNTEGLAVGEFRKELAAVIEQSAFKLVSQLEAKKEFQKAAEAYLSFVEEFPRSGIADKALFNASIDFYNARMLDKSIETRRRLTSQYPKSEYVPACIYANGEASEAIGDFAAAAGSYEDYADGYARSLGGEKKAAPKRAARGKKGKAAAKDSAPAKDSKQVWEESKAQIALFNAGVFRDGLGQYKAAQIDRDRYLDLWPSSKDAESVKLSIADLHERNDQYGKALKVLEEYEKDFGKDPNKMLLAEGRIARIYEEKLRKPKDARRIYARTLKFYEGLGPRGRKSLDNTALDAVGRAHFAESEDDYRHYTSLKLRWRNINNPAEFKNSVQDKAKALEVVQKRYTTTVGFKSGDPAICALHRIGESYDHFAKALIDAPMPGGMPPEFQDEFRTQLQQQAQPVREKAGEAFAAAVAKSQELDLFNSCYQKAIEALRSEYRPDAFPNMPEATPELPRLAASQAMGEGMLTSVQAVPTMTKEQAASQREKARQMRESTRDLGTRAANGKLDGGDLPPPTRGKRARPSADEEPAPVRTPSSSGDEPEDLL